MLGILYLISVGGVILFSSHISDVIASGSIALLSASVGGTAAEEDRYNIDVQLSEGSSQPQTVETSPLATGELLWPEEIEHIVVRLTALPRSIRH